MKCYTKKCPILCLLKEGMQTQECTQDLNKKQSITQKECFSNNTEYSQITPDTWN